MAHIELPPYVLANPEAFNADSMSVGAPELPATRNAKGQFVPGVSGNPNGRPKTHRAALLEGIESVIAVVKQAALKGDMQAAGLLLGRAVPTLKPESDLAVFELDVTRSVVDQCKQVLKAAADGKITFERARQFVDLIGDIKDLGDVEAALDELRRLKRGKSKSDDTMPAGHVLLVDAQELIVGRRSQ